METPQDSNGQGSQFVAPAELVDALKELNRHIEALKTIGGCGVASSVTSARTEREIIVSAIAARPPNNKDLARLSPNAEVSEAADRKR